MPVFSEWERPRWSSVSSRLERRKDCLPGSGKWSCVIKNQELTPFSPILPHSPGTNGYLWTSASTSSTCTLVQSGTSQLISQLFPQQAYQNEVVNISPIDISGTNATDGSVRILFSAQYQSAPNAGPPPSLNGTSAGWSPGTFVLTLESGTQTDLKQVSLPSNVTTNVSSGILNANGLIADIGNITTGTGSAAVTGTNHALLLVPVDITKLISDQISGNEANELPDGLPYKGDSNNPILMATRSGTTANIAVQITAPSLTSPKLLVGVRKVQSDNNGAILGATSAQLAPAKTLIQFTAESFHASDSKDTSNLYEVVAGYDSNGDGILSNSEAAVVFAATDGTTTPPHDKFRVVTKDYYDSSESTLENFTNVGGFAGNFLDSFLTGSAIPGAVASTFTLTSTYPGLSHPLGAVWSTPGNSASAILNTFGATTTESTATANSNAIHQIIDSTINSQKAEIVTYFVLNPTVASHDFTYSIPSSAGSVDFIKTEGGTSPLGLAFGKVTLTGSFTVTASPVGVITHPHIKFGCQMWEGVNS